MQSLSSLPPASSFSNSEQREQIQLVQCQVKQQNICAITEIWPKNWGHLDIFFDNL